MTDGDLERIEGALQTRFGRRELLSEAVTHRSFVNEHPELDAADNQRLEFLGDAVLDLIVGEWLFRRFPDADEGHLTNVRAHVVNTEKLASFAREIALGAHLRLGRGEMASGGEARPANLCAGFEALVGALYLDQGLETTRTWVHRFLDRHAADIDRQAQSRDAKSRFQELMQAEHRLTPSYRIVREEGPDHAKRFTAQVVIEGNVWGEGDGSTKQGAEQAAADAALRSYGELRFGGATSAQGDT